jgi:pSer/pThr/pTyr-binding forkhead associated (FHA) protein
MLVGVLNLEVVEGPDAGLQVLLQGSMVLGREESADVHLNDARVSRRHARLTAVNGEATVEDLGSANGTFVNHDQIHGSSRLQPGDELLLGTSVLTLRTSQEVQSRPSAVRTVPPALAAPPREPDYVRPNAAATGAAAAPAARPVTGPPQLTKLLDVRVRAQARLAPVALLALVALALVIYFAASR